MKILLIQPPLRVFDGAARPSASIPLGLLYIAAVLEKNRHEVEIYDARINTSDPICNYPNGEIFVGDDWAKIEKEIAAKACDIVGISNMFTAQRDSAIAVAEIVKKINKRILTVIGGSHPTIRPHDFFLKTDSIDIACMGEGEDTMLEIVNSFREKKDMMDIAGTAVRERGQVKLNHRRPFIKDLDSLPFPAYHLIDLEDYFLLNSKGFTDRPSWEYDGSERTISVVTSRGCPFHCIFCSIRLHMGDGWRPHSVAYVMEHLRLLACHYRTRHIHFEDDNLTLDQVRFKGLLCEMAKEDLPLTWDTPNGVRIDTLTKDILLDCKKTGCTYLIFGVESGNKRVLDEIIQKQIDLDHVRRVALWCKDICLDAMAFFVIGFPTESTEEMAETVDLAMDLQKRYGVIPSIFVATPLPGTKLEEAFRGSGCLDREFTPQEFARMTSGAYLVGTDIVGPQVLRDILGDFYKRFKKVFVNAALSFFMRHPLVFAKKLIGLKAKRKSVSTNDLALTLLTYKNCLLRGVGIRGI
jgi:radical SAM superfamily enzyme YgiQ (UPF0313 family)